jgi:hypothetical protein
LRLVAQSGDCWIWQGRITDCGYGQMSMPGRRKVYAHRASVIAFVGPIPDGAVIDHTCRNKACVNPAHLEVTTHSENTRRWWATRKASA